MIEVGRMQNLPVVRMDESRIWLGEGAEQALLPRQEAPQQTAQGHFLRVFVWRGNEGELLASLSEPAAQLGEFAYLKVSMLTGPGAFLEWGLKKDLLVPHAEQPEKMQLGRRYLVKICQDDRGRLVGTARIDRCLEKENIELAAGQQVDLVVWRFTDLGAAVIVDGLYSGLIYRNELQDGFRRGDRLKGYVCALRDGGKIDISLRRPGRQGILEAKDVILEALAATGFLPLHDDSSPQQIRRQLGMSKKAFKQAVGGLYREGAVRLSEKGVHLQN